MDSAAEAGSVKKYSKKVQWNKTEHYAFLKHVVYAIHKGHKKGAGLDKKGWDIVIALLKREDIDVDRSMLKNHYDATRRLWRGWTELREYDGLGWNPIAHTFIASNSVWEVFFKMHKDCKRFKLWGYDEEAEANLYKIFGKKHATGQNGISDSSGSQPPTETTPQDLPDRVDESGENMGASSPGQNRMSETLEEVQPDQVDECSKDMEATSPGKNAIVPPTETPQEVRDRVDECGEDMDRNSPTLDNDPKGEECVGFIREMAGNEARNSATEAKSVKKYSKKVQWNKAEHYAFLKHVVHAILKGHKKGLGLDKEGWDLVISLLKRENDIDVDHCMLKNHYDASKRLWRGWTELREYNGLGWNPIAHTFIMSNSIWKNFFKRHKLCKRLKLWGYDEEAEANLYKIFGKKHATERNRKYDFSGSVPPTKPPQELSDPLDECGEDMDANSPILNNDIDSENTGDEAPGTTELDVLGSTKRIPMASIPNTTASPRFSRPTTSLNTSNRVIGKRKSRGEFISAGHEIALYMKEGKAIAREAIHSAAIEDLEEEKYKKCLTLLKALPGYNLADPMYTHAATYFLEKPVRRLWLAMGDDAKFREKWLHGYWLEHRRV